MGYVKGVSNRGRRLIAALAGALALTVFGGCGGDRPDLGGVYGTVTLDGHPLGEAKVVFEPEDKQHRGSVGVTDAEGRYTLSYLREIDGATIGTHAVRISPGSETAQYAIPAKYNTQTTLTREVKRGDNRIDFELQSQ
jgi:hypothetical protein